MEESRVPVQRDRPSNVLDGGGVLARLRGDHAEEMHCVGLIRLDLENLPIDFLGGLQPPRLVVLDRNRQGFGSRCHTWSQGGLRVPAMLKFKKTFRRRSRPPGGRVGSKRSAGTCGTRPD